MTEHLKYPIGKPLLEDGNPVRRALWIEELARAPDLLQASVEGLTGKQLDTPYRPGGWTVRQVVHHVADSHMNAYIRCRLGLTETSPTIKTYDEAAWAMLPDYRLPVAVSLSLLAALHERWVALFRGLESAEFTKTITHPTLGEMSIDALLQWYVWHGQHHTAHVTELRRRQKWEAPAAPEPREGDA